MIHEGEQRRRLQEEQEYVAADNSDATHTKGGGEGQSISTSRWVNVRIGDYYRGRDRYEFREPNDTKDHEMSTKQTRKEIQCDIEWLNQTNDHSEPGDGVVEQNHSEILMPTTQTTTF